MASIARTAERLYTLDIAIDVNVPLIGGKIADFARGDAKRQVEQELAAGDAWLASHEWLYVLSGELRLILAGHDVIMQAGEVAEFDTALPHWFGSAGGQPVEILSLLSRQGERMHVRAKPRSRQ